MARLTEHSAKRMVAAFFLALLTGGVLLVLDSRELIWTKTYCTICGTVKDVKVEEWVGGLHSEREVEYHDSLELAFEHEHQWVEPAVDVMQDAQDLDQRAVADAVIREKVERLGPGTDLAEAQASLRAFELDKQRKVWAFALDPRRPFAWSALRIFQLDRPTSERWQLWTQFSEQYRCEGVEEITCSLEPSGKVLRVATARKQTYMPLDWASWTP